MEKIILTIFTDPMMGLSYESEPILRKLETHFPGQIEFRYAMGLLVRDVWDFMTPEERAMPPADGIARYNARLAKIYESEESIGGLPIHMPQLHLFDPEHRSSLPLNLAYHAARLTAPGLAEQFLYNLRYATIVDLRPTTHLEEILAVVRHTGIDEKSFLEHYRNGDAQAALEQDLTLARRLGVHSLPAYLMQCGDKAALFQSFAYADFVSAIGQLTNGAAKPQKVAPSLEALRDLLEKHSLISAIELREAFDFARAEVVSEFLRPLLEHREISIEKVCHGWFVRKNEPPDWKEGETVFS